MSQSKQILDHLVTGHTITAIEALEKFGCFRLSGRIHDLKKLGYKIYAENCVLDNGKVIARYYLDNFNSK